MSALWYIFCLLIISFQVIVAEGEQKASRALKEAAEVSQEIEKRKKNRKKKKNDER